MTRKSVPKDVSTRMPDGAHWALLACIRDRASVSSILPKDLASGENWGVVKRIGNWVYPTFLGLEIAETRVPGSTVTRSEVNDEMHRLSKS